jgi:signal transduction histidine kinase
MIAKTILMTLLLASLLLIGGVISIDGRENLQAHDHTPRSHAQATLKTADASQITADKSNTKAASGLSQFLPHGVCLLWDESLLLLHVLSDSIIALAYFSIPIALIVFVRKRKDLAFGWIFVCFAIFIVACGTTHIMGVWLIWQPVYWLDGIVKALTAAVSLVTAVMLWPLIPKAVALPSPAQLQAAYERLKEQNQLVERASRMKSEFLANMSHELRTPLNGIIGFAELMHDGKVGAVTANHREYLGDILSSAKHLLGLINDVLDLSKVETGKMEFRPEPVSLSKIVGEVRDIARAIAASKQIAIKIEIDDAAETLVIDPMKLKQVLYNFLSNALKFTGENGSIVVRAKLEDRDHFRIEVEDNGIGIQPDDMGRLFVEFQQLDAGSAKKFSGTGLGLALTKRIVEAQAGRVGVLSLHGVGSTFFAVLPRVCQQISAVDETTASGANWATSTVSLER